MGWEDLGHAFKLQDGGLKRGRLTTKYSWSEATYLQHHIWDNPLDSDVGLGHHLVCHAEKARSNLGEVRETWRKVQWTRLLAGLIVTEGT